MHIIIIENDERSLEEVIAPYIAQGCRLTGKVLGAAIVIEVRGR